MELKIGTVEPYILFIRNTYNLRFFSADETADADSMNMVARVEHYFKKAFMPMGGCRTRFLAYKPPSPAASTFQLSTHEVLVHGWCYFKK